MIVEYDPEADAAYIRLTERPVARTEEESDVCVIDLDAACQIVGIELLSVFGFAGASLHALARRGLLTPQQVDAALSQLRGELVAA